MFNRQLLHFWKTEIDTLAKPSELVQTTIFQAMSGANFSLVLRSWKASVANSFYASFSVPCLQLLLNTINTTMNNKVTTHQVITSLLNHSLTLGRSCKCLGITQ